MTDINWNNFRAKFNEKETKVFERLAYMLFCAEFNIAKGIFRFKNQIGIETEPIKVGHDEIGFQAKYYDTKIADNKEDILSSVEKAKRENPGLTKILLYTNQEPSESKTKQVKKPKYLTEIETKAKNIGVLLEWRLSSHIEVQLASPGNAHLAEYFFSLGKNIVDFLTEIKSHSENILFAIQSDIDFKETKIKVDRSKLIIGIDKITTSVAVIAGDGGSGKTALIKDIFQQSNDPVYVFKAAEFNLTHIADLFKRFGDFSLNDFIETHQQEAVKTMVIDSAEKLADLENQDAFKEFLAALIKNNWKILFTTRFSYLDDLKFQLYEIYRLHFEVMRIGNLSAEELALIADKNGFELPSDERLLRLIGNLFYLDEYLTQYQSFNSKTDLVNFKNILWQKKIQNSRFKKDNTHLERERCFIQLAKIRCETGNFYINAEHLDNRVLALLASDEIIQYEENLAGYFITHDIYEEWALDKIIEREYNSLMSYEGFFSEIGTSLAIRRAFRHWLSQKLGTNIALIKPFIESVFTSTTIPSFWKDELLVSVLLSEYSEDFFVLFEKLLLENEKSNLKKIIFLLRTACKEIDKMIHQNSSVMNEVSFDTAFFITQPKGQGWKYCIAFIYKHISEIKINELSLILALMDEWTTYHKTGEATRHAALFALHFYKESKKDKAAFYHEHVEKTLISVFMSGAAEIKVEISEVMDELLTSDINDRHRRNDDILESILSVKNDSNHFISVLPEYALKLADRFWYQPIMDRHPFDHGGYGTEKYYSIPSRWHHDYYPASSYQTPVYWALQSSFAKTIQFILDFTNRAVEDYAASGFDESLTEIDVYIDHQTTTKQYISGGLWNIYRGSGSPVSPYLLQSYHMALEKYLLAISKLANPENIEKWLIYLLKHSRSASITAVVASVVLAFQDEFFDVAAVLFRNYEFLKHDNWRLMKENEAKSLYNIGVGMNVKNKIHEIDRLDTLNEAHRKKSLEHRALEYQFFRNQGVTEEEAERRLNILNTIVDSHYEKVKAMESNDEETQNYRLMLARIDRRKMNPKVEQQEDQFVIDFNPEIDEELKLHREEAVKESTNMMRYTALKLWGTSKFEPGRDYGPYPQYDDSPALVIQEVKAIIDRLNEGADANFYLFNHTIPPFACYALIKDYADKLSEDDLLFCRNVVIEFSTAHLTQQYDYQISDGVEVAINALPFLYELFPDDRDYYDIILLLTLFDRYPIGEYKRVCDYAIEAINNNLGRISPDRAIRIFRGYFAFAEKFAAVDKKIQLAGRRTAGYRYSRTEVVDKFTTDHEADLNAFLANEIQFDETKVDGVDILILEATLNLVPTDTTEQVHLDFAKVALPILSKKLLKEDSRNVDDERADYKLRYRFFVRVAHFLLQREETKVQEWIKPFVDAFVISKESADFLQELISAEDKLKTYEPFWIIWDSFYDKIKRYASKGSYYGLNPIIHNYLLAWPWWRKTAKEWFSLKEREKLFYAKVTKELGENPAVLYGVSKILNEVAASYLNDGIIWISDMLTKNKNLYTDELETNTIYYMEVIVRKYVYLNRTKLKSDRYLKNKLLIVLEFLISKASVNAYLLREEIL